MSNQIFLFPFYLIKAIVEEVSAAGSYFIFDGSSATLQGKAKAIAIGLIATKSRESSYLFASTHLLRTV